MLNQMKDLSSRVSMKKPELKYLVEEKKDK